MHVPAELSLPHEKTTCVPCLTGEANNLRVIIHGRVYDISGIVNDDINTARPLSDGADSLDHSAGQD